MFSGSGSECRVPAPVALPTHIRTLLLDDSTFDRARIRRLSGRTGIKIQINEVDSIETMQVLVKKSEYDLLMIDYCLPVGDGIEALAHIAQDPLNRGAGVIMITGNGGVDTAVQAMRGGCHDFLNKNALDVDLLRSAMINAVTRARGQQHQRQADYQRDIIKRGMLAAFKDSEMKENVVSLLRSHIDLAQPQRPVFGANMDPGDVDMLYLGLNDEDEFQFS